MCKTHHDTLSITYHDHASLFRLLKKKRKTQNTSQHKGKIGKLALANFIDLTGPNTIARRTLDEMSENNKSSLEKKIGSTLQTKLNKNVRDAILDEAHFELLAKLNCEHRTKNVVPVTSMMHPLKPTMDTETGIKPKQTFGTLNM